MRDFKVPFLIAVPAAVTILGIVWFLRKKSGHDREGKKTKKEKVDKACVKVDDSRTPSHPTCVEEEGITLTQRKIPETAARTRGSSDLSKYGSADTVAGSSHDDISSRPLTESEREKVQEIVAAAIGAGLKEAKGEVVKEGKSTEIPVEETMVQSIASEQHSANNNKNTVQNVGGFRNNSDMCMERASGKNNTMGQGNYIDDKVINDFFSNEQTTSEIEESLSPSVVPKLHSSPQSSSPSTRYNASADTGISSHLPSSVRGDSESENLSDISSQSSNVPSKTVSITPQEDAVSPSTSADLCSSYSPPSNNTSKDSVLDDSSLKSDCKPEQQLQVGENILVSSHSSSCSSEPSGSTTNSVCEGSKVRRDSSTEQHGAKTEESSTNSTSPVCDSNSVGSSDSGRGGSEQDGTCQNTEALIHFDFNMPSELCGRLIGRQGRNINHIKSKSGASVSLTHNPLTAEFQICQVVGTQPEIDEALAMIRHKFPLADNPRLTMAQIALTLPKQVEQAAVLVPDNMQLSLPDGASVEVYVSTIVDAGHVFIQQPTHRSFMSLEKLNYFLNTVYGQDDTIPTLPAPIECGVICVCENEGSWYRAMVMSPEDEFGECQVKFVDYGGYTQLPISCIKQIRADFMNLPFQAVECFVANIAPLQGEEYFSTESTMALSEMSQMKLLQCQVVARNEMGTPYIHLYLVNAENNTAALVNRALVNEGLVRWVEIV